MTQSGTERADSGSATIDTPTPLHEGAVGKGPAEGHVQDVGLLLERAKELLRNSGSGVPSAIHSRSALARALREVSTAPEAGPHGS